MRSRRTKTALYSIGVNATCSLGDRGVANSIDTFNNDAYPNSWTPSLYTTWTRGVDRTYGSVSSRCYGVNIGELLVLEHPPFPGSIRRS
ncbi:uncharacterized protein BJ212DRAFT_1424451 [Suillus subaureus]|uniref:Uncharacterized protein n=1 Tax=Suillus subaureus TaxID=48587 RepID=A0A9P7EJ89_9AGAM|nr:uncharacterized protein BJ212DRAFT_1424451 [Suillus subaureus]KAG1823532.1 hypothetical protein BJ212DRAFT_1424451 [Suillus subaureus]